MIRDYRFEIVISVLIVVAIVALGITIHLSNRDERVKCESLFYLSETPKDSLLIIRADPRCNEF